MVIFNVGSIKLIEEYIGSYFDCLGVLRILAFILNFVKKKKKKFQHCPSEIGNKMTKCFGVSEFS